MPDTDPPSPNIERSADNPATEDYDINAEVRQEIRLSVIIVNWNTSKLLQSCLASMGPYLDSTSCEVIVVDNDSSDDSAAMVKQRFPRAKLVQLPENVGFSRGNNAGIRIARGRYILLLNSDTEVHADALWKMCDRMDHNTKIGALGARLINPDGSIQMSCRSFPSFRTALFNRKSLLTRLFPDNKYSREYLMSATAHTEPMEVDWVIGACLMTRRETIDDIGMLDEHFFMYAEDVDWCYRMRKAGWVVEYFPEATVMHHYEKSTSKAPFRMHKERHRSMWRFYKKHYSKNPALDAVTFSGIWLRFILNVARDRVSSLIAKP